MVIAFISSRPRPRSPGSPPRQGVRSVTTSTRGQLNCRSNSSGRGQISSSLCLMSDAFVVVPGGNSFRSATFKIPAHSGWENVRGTRSLVSAPHAQAGTPPGPPRGHSSPDMRGGWTRDLADPARTPRRLGCRQEEEDIWFTSSLTPPAGVLDPVLSSLIGQNSDRR